jgi:methionyl-tRNA formyltransferase
MRILFFGTPEFAATSLELIAKEGFNVVGVVTAPDKPAGRGRHLKSSEVKVSAEKLNIPIFQPTNLKSEDFLNEINRLNIDLGVVIAFRMLPMQIWSAPKLGTINLHASLLPNYRGAAPIQHAIIQGEIKTGVSTFFLKHEIDTGDLIDQQEVEIEENETGGSLHDKLMQVGSQLMIQSLRKIEAFGNLTPTFPQIYSEELKMASKISRDFCKIDTNQTAVEIHNKIRGLSPYPAAWIESELGELKIYASKIVVEPLKNESHDAIFIENKKLYIECRNSFLEIIELQPQGKQRMSAVSYLNGLR